MAICSVALTTGLLFGRSCCGKHTYIPMPWDTADHIETHSQWPLKPQRLGHCPAILAKLQFLGLDIVERIQHQMSSHISVRSPGSLRCVERQRVASPSRITCMELLTSPTFNGIWRSNSLTSEGSEKSVSLARSCFAAPPGLVFWALVYRMSTLDCWYG